MTYTAVINTIPEDAFFDEDGEPVDGLPDHTTLSEHRFDDLDEAARVTIERLTAARAECQDESFLGGYIVIGDDLQVSGLKGWLIEETYNGFVFDTNGPY